MDRIRPEEERNVLGSGEDVGELSDSSGVPEWVDQTPSDIITGTVRRIFLGIHKNVL